MPHLGWGNKKDRHRRRDSRGIAQPAAGALYIERDGREIELKSNKPLALVCYLAIKRGRHRREDLVNFFWPDAGRDSARAAMGEQAFTLARAEGRAMSLELGVAYALERSDKP